jgi:hypothetical protein
MYFIYFLTYLYSSSPQAIILSFHAPQTTDCNGHDTNECTNVRLREILPLRTPPNLVVDKPTLRNRNDKMHFPQPDSLCHRLIKRTPGHDIAISGT